MEEEFESIDKRNAWHSVYQDIRAASIKFEFSYKDARKSENRNLNRYRDVNPYDHSRVRLQRGSHDYINASLVEVPSANRSYILTQGPLKSTTGHFWLMIWEQNCTAILMLNRVVEKNAVKCHQYWPAGEANGGDDQYVLSDVGLLVSYENEESVPNYTVRKFTLLDFQTGKSRTILQFHYTTWPDFGVPESPAAFLNFLFAVRDAGVLNDNVGPAVVHCSAGIGRSGTFCLVDSCLVLIEKSGDRDCISIRDVLLDMRKYRMGLIQTPDQLRFSYLAVIEGSKTMLNKEETIVPSKIKQINPKTLDEKDEMSEESLSQSDSSDEGIANSNTCTSASTSPPPVPPRPIRNHDTSTSNSISDSSLLPDISPKISPENSISPLLLNEDTKNKLALDSSVESHMVDAKDHALNLLTNENMQEQLNEDYEADIEESTSDLLVNENAKNKSSKLSVTVKSSKTIDNEIVFLKEVLSEDTKTRGRCETRSPESSSELRKRQRLERSEKTAAKVQQIKKKQKEIEIWQKRRLLIKRISFGLVLLIGTSVLVYRCYSKD